MLNYWKKYIHFNREELQQVAQKIGQVLYQQQGGAGQGGPQVDPSAYQQAAEAAQGAENHSSNDDDNVVDAEFKKA